MAPYDLPCRLLLSHALIPSSAFDSISLVSFLRVCYLLFVFECDSGLRLGSGSACHWNAYRDDCLGWLCGLHWDGDEARGFVPAQSGFGRFRFRFKSRFALPFIFGFWFVSSRIFAVVVTVVDGGWWWMERWRVCAGRMCWEWGWTCGRWMNGKDEVQGTGWDWDGDDEHEDGVTFAWIGSLLGVDLFDGIPKRGRRGPGWCRFGIGGRGWIGIGGVPLVVRSFVGIWFFVIRAHPVVVSSSSRAFLIAGLPYRGPGRRRRRFPLLDVADWRDSGVRGSVGWRFWVFAGRRF
ncbi:hypothetical protein FA15DRAFT_252101 [Coprinopsis marcescibilis]|uniref:Uncharacterized protein n=1 Tax=Coprinopsis marcescibilis TaxID=230819 RepID=A0A5C3KF03_COPMA|nr:hypothetical protein FA15DRAFT_252101 [Coprinopsis marcescibilis]